jgi:Predicted metal-binding, possibly nucleic acid-binding protein
MLNLNLRETARADVPVRGEIAPDDPLWADAQINLQGPVKVDLVAQEVAGSGVLVRGRINAVVELECRRCLEPVQQEIDDEITLLYDNPPEGEEAEESGEIYPLPERGDVLDLSEAVREQLLLRIPLHTLCRPDCKGICAQCGGDLNMKTCGCVPEAPPSAWDALKDLKFD